MQAHRSRMVGLEIRKERREKTRKRKGARHIEEELPCIKAAPIRMIPCNTPPTDTPSHHQERVRLSIDTSTRPMHSSKCYRYRSTTAATSLLYSKLLRLLCYWHCRVPCNTAFRPRHPSLVHLPLQGCRLMRGLLLLLPPAFAATRVARGLHAAGWRRVHRGVVRAERAPRAPGQPSVDAARVELTVTARQSAQSLPLLELAQAHDAAGLARVLPVGHARQGVEKIWCHALPPKGGGQQDLPGRRISPWSTTISAEDPDNHLGPRHDHGHPEKEPSAQPQVCPVKVGLEVAGDTDDEQAQESAPGAEAQG